jgi:hypothetical protein
MRAFVLAAVVATAVLAALPAWADPTSPAASPATAPTIHVPEHTFRVRLDKPHVVIDVKTPTAASAAGEAHEAMRAWMMQRYEPATMRAPAR